MTESQTPPNSKWDPGTYFTQMYCHDRTKQNFQNLGVLSVLDVKTTKSNSLCSLIHLYSVFSKTLRHWCNKSVSVALLKWYLYRWKCIIWTKCWWNSEGIYPLASKTWNRSTVTGWQQTHRVPQPAPLPALHGPAVITSYQEQSFTSCLPGRLPREAYSSLYIHLHTHIYMYT